MTLRKSVWLLLMGSLCLLQGWGGVVGIDQAGYRPGDVKVAYLSTRADSFIVVNAMSRAVALQGVCTLSMALDSATGMTIWKADFSRLRSPGEYVLMTSAGDSSQHFAVAEAIYGDVYRKALRGFFFQRCGMELAETFAGQWHRAGCHTADAVFHPTTGRTGTKSVSGGWHDAGDYGRYSVNAGITVGMLLMAYEWFPDRFTADDLNIPESANGVPDILDESRYELAWLLSMQDSSGGVFFKVTHRQFEGFIMPAADTAANYIYGLSTTATGDFVAVMSRAARIFRAFDPRFADTCLAAAKRGWAYLLCHTAIVPTGGFTNPPDTFTGEYADRSDADERLWAAAEWYLTTGDSSSHTYFLDHVADGRGIITRTMYWDDVRPLAACSYLRGTRPGINVTVRETIRASLAVFCSKLISLRDASGFHTALPVSGYGWGSNGFALSNALLLIIGSLEGGGSAMEEAALEQLHYVLGVNGCGYSFVTGIGGKSTMYPHHRPSAADGVVAPVPGLMVGGPDHHIKDDATLAAAFSPSSLPALCYADKQPSYASNEIAINWNAPLVFVAGYFNLHSGH